MKRFIKMLMVTCVAAFALAGMGAAGASASAFTYSATGSLLGAATTVQTFTISGTNVVKCAKATVRGKVESTSSTAQEVTVFYTECVGTFYGIPTGVLFISGPTYRLTANGEAHLLEPIRIVAGALGCETIINSGQTISAVTYTNKSAKVEAHFNLSGIVSTSPNGCPTGTSGAFTGSSLIEREGGGSISWDM